ncbi:hypothetical protein IT575_08320 [bacterium]|nr:hypothetical protein [bacterium]
MEPLRQLLRSLPFPAQLWDSEGRVLLTNAGFNRALGYPAELVWENAGMRFLEERQVKAAGLSEHCLAALGGRQVEIASFDYDPSHSIERGASPEVLKRFSVSLRPLFAGSGKVSCVVCLLADYGEISDRMDRDLMRSQKMENVEALASSVAHEFNNIFTGIRGLSELIKDSVTREDEVFSFADSIQENIQRGAELINKLTSFARELPHSLKRMRIKDYVERALPLLNIQVQRRIKIDLDLQCDAEVLLDANRMDQALTNIVGNSRDALGGQGNLRLRTMKAEPPAELLTAAERNADGWVMLEIADSGPGIPAELQARVMQPFFSTKERGKSTGLGLSVTQRIIELHQGVLAVGNSADLGGAAVRIYLPAMSAIRQLGAEAEMQSEGA